MKKAYADASIDKFTNIKPEEMMFPNDYETTFEVFVSAVANPNYFWIQLVDENLDKFDSIMRDMNRYYQNNKYDKVRLKTNKWSVFNFILIVSFERIFLLMRSKLVL